MSAFGLPPIAGVDETKHTKCTYAVTQTNLFTQEIYVCHTCNRKSSKTKKKRDTTASHCCCSGCADKCHASHDVEFVANGAAFCDCGHGEMCTPCILIEQSLPVAAELLRFNEHGGGIESLLMHQMSSPPLATNNLGFDVCQFAGLDVHLSQLRGDCMALVAKSKETFWLGADAPSRCGLEELAAAIYSHHVGRGKGTGGTGAGARGGGGQLGGAEWWVQVKPISSSSSNSSSSSSAIDLHYDKDEELAEAFGLGVFPSISTVTYLTDCPGKQGGM